MQHEAFTVRKPEKGTGPKIFYLGAEEARSGRRRRRVRSITRKARCICGRSARRAPIPQSPGDPRVDYDMPHGKPWGIDMVLYLFMKAVSTGAMLLGAMLWLLGYAGPLVDPGGAGDLDRLHRR